MRTYIERMDSANAAQQPAEQQPVQHQPFQHQAYANFAPFMSATLDYPF